MPEWSLKYNCYECAHPWTRYCSVAHMGIAIHALKEALKMYSALNLCNFIYSRQYDRKSAQQCFKNTINSSIFLSVNAYLIFTFFCFSRLSAGKFYYSLSSFLPCFLACYAAIFIERTNRRSALALYLVNIATECYYRVLVQANYIKPIPKGEVILFAVSMSLLMYLNRIRGMSNDPISFVIRYLIGDNESKRGLAKNSANHSSNSLLVNGNQELAVCYIDKHVSCPHPKQSCYSYSFRNFIRSFSLSYGTIALITLARGMTRLYTNPKLIRKSLFNSHNIRLGLFLAFFTSSYRAFNCFLRRQFDGPQDWHALLAGGLAGTSMLISPNSTVATYVTWKCIENLYCYGYQNQQLPNPNRIIPVLYAACVTAIFYGIVLRPNTIRPSYIKFMDTLSDHKIHLMNRNILSIFRTGAEKGYEDYVPNLDIKYCSNAFIETYLIWLL